MTSNPTASWPSVGIQEGRDERSKRTYWYRYTHKFAFLKCRTSAGNKIAQQDADQHGEKDPYNKKAIQKPKAFERRCLLGCFVMILCLLLSVIRV